jgi:hypothetical protein
MYVGIQVVGGQQGRLLWRQVEAGHDAALGGRNIHLQSKAAAHSMSAQATVITHTAPYRLMKAYISLVDSLRCILLSAQRLLLRCKLLSAHTAPT